MANYIPGVCNIGPAEIRLRRWAGIIGAGATVVWIALAMMFDWPRELRALAGLPAFTAAIGFLQAGMHFCAGFGVLGLRNMGVSASVTESVVQSEFRRKDTLKALQIILFSVVSGLLTAGILWLI